MESPEEHTPEISVILQTANHGVSLYPTLLCLCNQQNGENLSFEIIVLDSGVDDIESMISLFRERGNSLIRHEKINFPCSRSASLNRGASLARGRILLFIEEDFLVPPDYIAAHCRAHAGRRDAVVLDSCRMLIDFTPEKIGYDRFVRNFSFLETFPSCLPEGDHRAFPGEPCGWRQLDSSGFSVRRELFFAANSFCEEFTDCSAYGFVDFGIRLCRKGVSFEAGMVSTVYRHSSLHGCEPNNSERDIFLRRNQCFEAELYAGFRESFDRYYPGLTSLASEVFPRLLAETPSGYRLIMGCVCSAIDPREIEGEARFVLGALIPFFPDASVNRALVLSTFYFFPYRMQLSLLREALRIAEVVDVQRRMGVNENFVEGLCRVIGYAVSVIVEPEVFRIDVRQRCPSRMFAISVPDVFTPRLRFFYLRFARELQQSGAFVICKDTREVDNFYGEDFSFPRDVASFMASVLTADKGCCDVRFITSETLLNHGFSLAKNREADIVANDQEYISISGMSPLQEYDRCRCLDQEYIERHIVRYLTEFLRRNPPPRQAVDSDIPVFGCFMESGYLEDGIDLVLDAFSVAIGAGLRGSLVVKLPDYDMLAGKNFPRHNAASRYGKNYGTMYKAEHDFFLLERKVRSLGLETRVSIMRQNMDMFGIVKLIDSFTTLLCGTRGMSVPVEAYAAILMGKRILLPVQCCIDSCFSHAIVRVSSELFPFSASFGVPVCSVNASFLAYEINVGDLAKKIPLRNDYVPIDTFDSVCVNDMITACKRDLIEL